MKRPVQFPVKQFPVKLSIVTLHTNDPLILETLSSVYATVKIPFEYILVDNKSKPERLAAIKEKFPKIRIVQNPKNYGYARGINKGLRLAQGEFVLALNPDIVVFEKTIDQLVKYLEKHPDAAIIGPQLLNADKTLQYSCRRYPTLLGMLFRRGPLGKFFSKQTKNYEMCDSDHTHVQDVDWLCGGFLLTRKSLFEQVGYLDEFYFLYFDDVDFCRRAHDSGKVMYYPLVSAIHAASYESKRKLIPFLIHLRSMIYYFLKFALFPQSSLEKWKGWA